MMETLFNKEHFQDAKEILQSSLTHVLRRLSSLRGAFVRAVFFGNRKVEDSRRSQASLCFC
jgi:hypothetical protein